MNGVALIKFALRLTWQDFRSGKLKMMLTAMFIAVFTITLIGLFTNRIQNSILAQASQLLAAEAQIQGSRPIEDSWVNQAEAMGLELGYITEFSAMAFGQDDSMQLASVKAVSDTYPLVGKVSIKDRVDAPIVEKDRGPAQGEAWVSERLLFLLNLSIGDSVGLGDADYIVTQILHSEPDGGAGGFSLNPKIMIHENDLEQVNAIMPGSRVEYTLLLSGESVEEFKQGWEALEAPHHEWRSIENASDRVSEILQLAERFLLLSGCLGVVIASVALVISSRQYAQQHFPQVAILKTIGLTPKNIGMLYFVALLFLALASISVSILSGWLFHKALLWLFASSIPFDLAPAGSSPILLAIVTGLVCLFAFAFPPIWQLRFVSPASIFKNEGAIVFINTFKSLLIGVLAVCMLVYLYSASLWLTLAIVASGVLLVLGVVALVYGLVNVLYKVASKWGVSWRLGFASLNRNRQSNNIQIMMFSLVLMLLFMVVLLRTSLISQWQEQLPDNTPNHFAFNIVEYERTEVIDFLNEHQLSASPLYPIVRGRIISVNGQDIAQKLAEIDPEGDQQLRELNMTWFNELPVGNEIVSGYWFKPATDDAQAPVEISVAEDLMDDVPVSIGDRLTFSFGGQRLEALITSIRSVKWDSFTPNFFVIFNQPVVAESATYLTSFYLPPDKKMAMSQFLQQHPTISIIDVEQTLSQLREIVAQISIAIEGILLLVLISSLVVLFSATNMTFEERLKEHVILRTLGARARVMRGAIMVEFATMGGLAGLLAAISAQLGVFLLQAELFNMEQFVVNGWLIVFGPLIGALIIVLAGLIATRKVMSTPPLTILRSLS